MPTFDEHFYQREQPQTFCPVTAAFLDSLHLCTKSGLMLMNSLLQDVHTFKELKKWTPAFQIWHAFARGLPVATKFSPISRKSIPRHCAHIRTSVNQLQTDMNRLLAAPPNLTIQQLPLLLYNFPNLMDWLHHTREFRLLQIRRTIQYLINLDEGLLQDLDIQVEPADYVAEWVISRRVARSTIVGIVIPRDLATLPSFAPETLIEELLEGISPQKPWYWSMPSLSQSNPPSLIHTPAMPLLAPQLPTPSPTPPTPLWQERLSLPTPPMTPSYYSNPDNYSPNSPIYQPAPSIPPTPLQLPVQLPPLILDRPTNQSTNPSPSPSPLTPITDTDSLRYPSLPPIVTLEEQLPVTARLLASLNANDPRRQNIMMEAMNTLTMMSLNTT
ncbi:hypothetical protein Agabi119p4_9220 [Agaricus bisporus var. burnettii]|nr:hypothetical protein Agabi119p4_9220 [Agaricus bisporus var. burnettii]